ncbi:MAG: ATP-dependent DNA helicase Rep [Parasphingorhabdus sp.]
MKLNPPQKKAVTHQGSPLLVLAGAGSGKTGVITRRIAWLVEQQKVPAENIFAVTFTNKAAREMKQRVANEIVDKQLSKKLTISTFHSLGMRIIRKECSNLGLTSNFSIVDPADALSVLRDLLQRDFNEDAGQAEKLQAAISTIKSQSSLEAGELDSSLPLMKLYEGYQRYLKACNAIDLDDLISIPRQLLASQSDVLNRWRQRVHYLLVDEYQDTNASQYDLVKLLTGSGAGLTVVGDDDQSIYAWRGAMPENLFQLAVDFPDLEQITLDQNYRSMGRILKLANGLIKNNPRPFEKNLWSELGYGDPVRVYSCPNEVKEAEKVVSELMTQRFQKRSELSDFAILYRSNHQARIIEQKLMEMQIPYKLSGGRSFFDRSEIRDVLAYLKLVANPVDDSSLMRIINTPRRGIGAATLEKVALQATKNSVSISQVIHLDGLEHYIGKRQGQSLREFSNTLIKFQDWAERAGAEEIMDDLLEEIGYRGWLDDQCDSPEQAERRWKNVLDLKQWIGRMAKGGEGGDLGDIVRRLCLTDMLDRQEDDDNNNQVSLMTMHAAKGLEFNHVFIVGVEEGILPHQNSQGKDGIEEERRLFYVGITRAKKNLCLTLCMTRRRFGELLVGEPSRFLEELPQDDLDWRRPNQADAAEERQTGKAHLAGIREMLGRN